MLHLQKVLVFLVPSILLTLAKSTDDYKEYAVKEIDRTLDNLSENNDKLRILFRGIIDAETKINVAAPEEECVCVPYYLCNNGDINTDGTHLLENRMNRDNPCYNIGDICCEPYAINNTESTKEAEEAECGYSEIIHTNETANDDAASTKFGEFPWTVIILTSNYKYECVGSLIHPKIVLTAAHCVNNSDTYFVRVGEWDTVKRIEPYPHQNEQVKFVVKHPDFNRDNLFYNVALLVLENSVKMEKNVKTVCLTDSTPSPLRTSFDECVATGWGMDKPKSTYKRKMKKVEFSLMHHNQCQEKLRTTRLGKWFELHQTFICAMGQYGRDMCTGDGGGPLVCPISGVAHQYQQVGITAWGIGCAENLPSIFTKVSQIKNWIDKQFSMLNLSKNYYTYKRG